MGITFAKILLNGRINIAPPVGLDPHFSNVAMLLHGDGEDGSTNIIDSGPLANPITRTNVNYPAITTTQKVFGTGSIFFNGYGLTAPHNNAFDLTSGNFTIEMRYYPTAFSGVQMLACHRNVSGSTGYNMRVLTDGKFQFWYTGQDPSTSTVSVSLNTWNTLAICRSGSNLYFFLNGALVNTFGISNGSPASSVFRIGLNEVSSETVRGYLDEYRITKGVARYTASYTPTGPFPNS